MSILSRFRRPTPPAVFLSRTDDFAELADLYPPAEMAVLVAAMDTPSLVDYVPPSYPFSGIDVAIEAEVLDRLAALTVKGSPWEAARTLFGEPHA